MSWEDIDNIPRETGNRFNYKKERIPASVEHIVNKIDFNIRLNNEMTEADFHKVDSKAVDKAQDSHLKATLAKVSRWQSLCGTNTG